MVAGPLLVGLDVGTSSVRSVLFDRSGRVVRSCAMRQRTRTPRPGWVEQDAEELARLSLQTLRAVAPRTRAIAALGVTNQRESLVAVDARTGKPLAPVVVWQDARTGALARELSRDGWGERAWDLGGLPLTTYPTAPKMLWLMRNHASVRKAASQERLLLGTVDSWILFRLMGGRARSAPWITDGTNASRTLLYGLDDGAWSPTLMEHFEVHREALAEVRPSLGTTYGEVSDSLGLPGRVPIAADLGDQQAGLLGVAGVGAGAAKLTFGTGAFFLAEGAPRGTGRPQGLIRTLLREHAGGERALALEGGVGAAGSLLDWLCQDGLRLFPSPDALERAARLGGTDHGLVFVPALAGMFAPHWKPEARGTLQGLTRATSRAELARAALEGIAHRVADILDAYRAALPRRRPTVWADGGLCRSTLLLQMVSDLSGLRLLRSPFVEATARGAALAAGLSVGIYPEPTDLPLPSPAQARSWAPRLRPAERNARRESWRSALRSLS